MLILIGEPRRADAGLTAGNGRNLASTYKKLRPSLVAVVPDFRGGGNRLSRSPTGPSEVRGLRRKQVGAELLLSHNI